MFIAVEMKEAAERLLVRWEQLLAVLNFDTLTEKSRSLREQLQDERLWASERITDAQRLQRGLRNCERATEPAMVRQY